MRAAFWPRPKSEQKRSAGTRTARLKTSARLPLERVRAFAADAGLEATFTMAAEAREYRETVALGKMNPEEREKYHLRNERMDEVDA